LADPFGIIYVNLGSTRDTMVAVATEGANGIYKCNVCRSFLKLSDSEILGETHRHSSIPRAALEKSLSQI